MSEHEKEFYNILNTQYNLVFNRAQAIETKAINFTIFASAILGLEYTILYNFSSNILAMDKNLLFYLVALSSSFFFSSILLAIITIFESHNFHLSEIAISNECCGKNELFPKLLNQLKDILIENELKIESKERLLKAALFSFLLGIFVILWLSNHIIRYSIHS